MTATQWMIVLEVGFGSGIILYLIRLGFMLGQYTQRVATLEEAVRKFEVTVEGFRVDLNSFRERRVTAQSDRRAHSS